MTDTISFKLRCYLWYLRQEGRLDGLCCPCALESTFASAPISVAAPTAAAASRAAAPALDLQSVVDQRKRNRALKEVLDQNGLKLNFKVVSRTPRQVRSTSTVHSGVRPEQS
jgi:hypothetical protein